MKLSQSNLNITCGMIRGVGPCGNSVSLWIKLDENQEFLTTLNILNISNGLDCETRSHKERRSDLTFT